jgi:membrane protease YdiL (CAAX protease family)
LESIKYLEPYVLWGTQVIALYFIYKNSGQFYAVMFLLLFNILVPIFSSLRHNKSVFKLLGFNRGVMLVFLLGISLVTVSVFLILPYNKAIEMLFNVILQPIAEEFFFRVYIFRAFISNQTIMERRTIFSAFLSSLCFSFGHLIVPYFVWEIPFDQFFFYLLVVRWLVGVLFCCLLLSISYGFLLITGLHMLINYISLFSAFTSSSLSMLTAVLPPKYEFLQHFGQ